MWPTVKKNLLRFFTYLLIKPNHGVSPTLKIKIKTHIIFLKQISQVLHAFVPLLLRRVRELKIMRNKSEISIVAVTDSNSL